MPTEPTTLNCPFCGNQPQFAEFHIYCEHPTCKVQPCTDDFDSMDAAVAAWNTRAEPAKPEPPKSRYFKSHLDGTSYIRIEGAARLFYCAGETEIEAGDAQEVATILAGAARGLRRELSEAEALALRRES